MASVDRSREVKLSVCVCVCVCARAPSEWVGQSPEGLSRGVI